MPSLTELNADIPRYQAVKDYILTRIRSGVWAPTQAVPSEHELMRTLGVARMTANRALRELAAMGVLKRVPGLGTFVADLTAASHPLALRNIAEEIRERGHQHHARVLQLTQMRAPPAAAAHLALAADTPEVYVSKILHYENKVPIQLELRYVNPRIAPDYLGVDFCQTTPHAYLVAIAPLERVEHKVRAERGEHSIRQALALVANEPILLIERTTWSGGIPATYTLLHHPGSRFELSGTFNPG
jgi:GntR family histidine utilization transcriptional repressor